MQRYRQYGQLDDAPEIVGDAGFGALDMLSDPATLPPGTLAVSENLRFDVNGLIPRAGVARQFAPGASIGRILWAGLYKPTNDDDNLALVTNGALVLFRTVNQTLTAYAYPDNDTVPTNTNIDVVQGGLANGTTPQLRILRGLVKTVLVYDGAGSVSEDSDTPPSETGLYYQDRIVVNNGTQSLIASDFDDFTTYTQLSQYQISSGGDDFLTGMTTYQNDYVLIAFRKSWYIAFFAPLTAGASDGNPAGYSGGLNPDTSFLRVLTEEAGAVGPRAIYQANGKIWFISDGAIYSFVPQLDATLTVLPKPISAVLKPVMDNFSALYARGAWIERYGYRLYFGMPINDAPVMIAGISVSESTATSVTLPFTLPVLLGPGNLTTVTTATPHGLQPGDTVFIAGASFGGFNGSFTVQSVMDAMNYIFTPQGATGSSILGGNATSQRIATRNNRIAVYNLNNQAWESVDTLPPGIYADFAVSANFGTKRRLYIIDALYGPMLYEQNPADDVGTVLGGIALPFTLPAILTSTNYATATVPGHALTRCFRWGYSGTLSGGYTGNLNSSAVPRKVRSAEARATLDTASALTLTLQVRTPNNTLWSGVRSFTAAQFNTADAPLRKMCGTRGIEAQVDLRVTAGRPTFRSVFVETAAVGRVEE